MTEVFVHEAKMQRAALGMDALEPVVIAHPLSTLTDEEIAGRAKQAAASAIRVLLGAEPRGDADADPDAACEATWRYCCENWPD